MSKIVITSVGTSFFTNYFDKGKGEEFAENYHALSSLTVEQANSERIDELRKEFRQAYKGELIASAEMKSLDEIQKYENDKITVHFIASESVISKIAAELITELWRENTNIRFHKTVHVIEGLQVTDRDRFETQGLENLIKSFKIITDDKYENVLINVTGGYKALIPYMSILGELYDIPIYYIFEESEELIRIPKLPVQFDSRIAEQYYPVIERDRIGFDNKRVPSEAFKELKRYFIFRYNKNQRVWEITAIGKLFRDYVDKEVPIGKSVLGYMAEYKLFEYYVSHPYRDKRDQLYTYVRRSVENAKYGGYELDLVMKTDRDSKDFIAIEIKSYRKLYPKHFNSNEYQNEESLTERVYKHIRGFKRNKAIPLEYHLVFHFPKGNKWVFENKKGNIRSIRKIFSHKLPDTEVRLYGIAVDINIKSFKKGKIYYDENPYQNVLKSSLKKNEIIEL